MYFKVPDTIVEAGVIERKSLTKKILEFIGVIFLGSILQEVFINIVQIIMLLVNGKIKDIELVLKTLLDPSLMDEPVLILFLFSTILGIVVAIYHCVKREKRPVTSMGFRKMGMFKEYGKGLLLGFILISLVVGIEILTGALKITGLGNLSFVSILLIIVFMIGFFIQSAEEEIMLRGYFLTSLSVNNSIPVAIIVSSFGFGLLHIFNDGFGIISLINISLIGVFLALYYIQTNNIWGVAAIHGIWNFAQGNIYGIQVSGMNITRTVFVSKAIEGKELLNGGSFGAEAGIVSTIVYILFIIGILIFMYKKGTLIKKERINA